MPKPGAYTPGRYADPLVKEEREEKLPTWAYQLIRDLRDLVLSAQLTEKDALAEAAAATGNGPEDSDTFIDREFGDSIRLGKHQAIRFVSSDAEGTEYDVEMLPDGALHINSSAAVGRLAIIPVDSWIVTLRNLRSTR